MTPGSERAKKPAKATTEPERAPFLDVDLNPEAPADLRPATRAWWAEVARTFVLEVHALASLTAAARLWDRAEAARELIASDGFVLKGRFGDGKPNPALKIERDSLLAFSRLLKTLGLDVEPPGPVGRPPKG